MLARFAESWFLEHSMSGAEHVSILVIDDNPLVGPALERWFVRLSSFRYVGSLGTTRGAPEAVKDSGASVVLLDFHMPGEDVVACIGELAKEHPEVHVAIFSAYLEPDNVRRCMDAGARGYLSKAETPAGLAAKIQMIVQGSRVFSPDVEAALLADGGYPGA